ncbi:MAG: MBL fold metallo-hydrolase, partial [Streptosporangiaceae bacterium]
MQLTIVGCAGSFPGPDSAASCYLIEADGFRLVMDLGSGGLGPLQRYCGLDEVDAVCLSHLHGDHCLDMCGYSVARTYHPDGRRPRLPVYA